MSFLVWVYSPDENGELKEHPSVRLNYQRSLRITPNKVIGVNIRGKIYPVYKGNFSSEKKKSVFFNPKEDRKNLSDLNKDLTPILSELEAEFYFNNLGDFGKHTSTATQKLSKEDLQTEAENTDSLAIEGLEVIDINKELEISIPKYRKDWRIDKLKYYYYVVFNDDQHQRRQQILSILREPAKFALVDSNKGGTGFYSLNNVDDKFDKVVTGGKLVLPDPNPRHKVGLHKTFKDRYGELDFLSRAAENKSPNGIKYDYWIRFSLNLSEDFLKSLFEDLFKVLEVSNFINRTVYKSQENTIVYDASSLEDDPIEEVQTKSEIKNNKESEGIEPLRQIIDDKLDSVSQEQDELKEKVEKILDILAKESKNSNPENEEVIEAVNKENSEARDAIISLQDKIEIYQMEIEDLEKELINSKQSIFSLKEGNEKLSKNLANVFPDIFANLLPEFIFLERGLKTFQNKFTDPKPLLRVLHKISSNSAELPLKKVQKTNNWFEVDKKISNGNDDQGRIYLNRSSNNSSVKMSILIGHKQDQDSDINFLLDNENIDL